MSRTRYIDKDGEVWEHDGSGYAKFVRNEWGSVADGLTLPLDKLIARYGPISLAPDRAEEIRTAALETVLSDFPYTVEGTRRNEDGTVRLRTIGGGVYTIDVTVKKVAQP